MSSIQQIYHLSDEEVEIIERSPQSAALIAGLEKFAELRSLLDSDKTTQQISDYFGIRSSDIARKCNNFNAAFEDNTGIKNIIPYDSNRRLIIDNKQIIDMYNDNTLELICKKLGMKLSHLNSITKKLVERGILKQKKQRFNEYDKILELYETKTNEEIAKIIGVQLKTLTLKIKELREKGLLKPKHQKNNEKNETFFLVKKMWDEGMTISEISRITKIKRPTLHERIKKWRIAFPGSFQEPQKEEKLSDYEILVRELIVKFINSIDEKTPIKELPLLGDISKYINIDTKTVARAIRELIAQKKVAKYDRRYGPVTEMYQMKPDEMMITLHRLSKKYTQKDIGIYLGKEEKAIRDWRTRLRKLFPEMFPVLKSGYDKNKPNVPWITVIQCAILWNQGSSPEFIEHFMGRMPGTLVPRIEEWSIDFPNMFIRKESLGYVIEEVLEDYKTCEIMTVIEGAVRTGLSKDMFMKSFGPMLLDIIPNYKNSDDLMADLDVYGPYLEAIRDKIFPENLQVEGTLEEKEKNYETASALFNGWGAIVYTPNMGRVIRAKAKQDEYNKKWVEIRKQRRAEAKRIKIEEKEKARLEEKKKKELEKFKREELRKRAKDEQKAREAEKRRRSGND